MNDLNPKVTPPKGDFDAQMVLDFLAAYHALEQALVRAGFTRSGRRSGNPRPDWGGFARRIEKKFDPGSSPELMEAVCTLLGQPLTVPVIFRGARELRRELLTPVSDVLWLAERVREIRDRLLLRINFAGVPWGDDTIVVAAWYVVQAWSAIDPKVQSLLPLFKRQ